METILYYTAITVLTTVVVLAYCSIFEWSLHRFVMHRSFFGFDYAFKAHAQVHHHIFRADDSYHLRDDKTKKTIPMAWWNGPVLVLLSSVPFDLIGWWFETWSVPITSVVIISAYYGTYEYLHWCMHLPKRRRLESSKIFMKLNGHHILHHRYQRRNFNVVLPLADLLFGTLLLRAKKRFNQARGPSVPDVQPLT